MAEYANCAICTHVVIAHALYGCEVEGCECPFNSTRQPTGTWGQKRPDLIPCSICQWNGTHHEDCPVNLRLPDGGGCMACACGPLAEHADDCISWAFLGKTLARLRRGEQFRPVANAQRVQVLGELPDVPEPASNKQVGGNHYVKFKIQPWDVIDEYGLTFYAGNTLKYLLRAGHKGVALEDLRKARHYLDRMIEIEEEKDEG